MARGEAAWQVSRPVASRCDTSATASGAAAARQASRLAEPAAAQGSGAAYQSPAHPATPPDQTAIRAPLAAGLPLLLLCVGGCANSWVGSLEEG